MEFSEYQSKVSNLDFGKRLPSALYLHIDGLHAAPDGLREIVEAQIQARDPQGNANIIKLNLALPKISLLSYPDFDTDPHPALRESTTIDLITGKTRFASYEDSRNPPILHRKEAFLPRDDPRIKLFSTLTEEEEKYGLFDLTRSIGFKKNWVQLLASRGLKLLGHELHQVPEKVLDNKPKSGIQRGKTALKRYDLSRPVKNLLEFGLLRKGDEIFDYGCGRGSDVKGLRSLGYEAWGWDPNHAPDGKKAQADVVNLGFVLNVIEDPAERVEALELAWGFTRRVLIVSTMIKSGTADTVVGESFQDGIKTQLNTFQKYYEQGELSELISHAVQVEPIPCGLGVFLVFREESETQDFLSSRYKRVVDWEGLSLRLGLGRPQPRERKPRLSLYERHKDLLDEFWTCLLDYGRVPWRYCPTPARVGCGAQRVQSASGIWRRLSCARRLRAGHQESGRYGPDAGAESERGRQCSPTRNY